MSFSGSSTDNMEERDGFYAQAALAAEMIGLLSSAVKCAPDSRRLNALLKEVSGVLAAAAEKNAQPLEHTIPALLKRIELFEEARRRHIQQKSVDEFVARRETDEKQPSKRDLLDAERHAVEALQELGYGHSVIAEYMQEKYGGYLASRGFAPFSRNDVYSKLRRNAAKLKT